VCDTAFCYLLWNLSACTTCYLRRLTDFGAFANPCRVPLPSQKEAVRWDGILLFFTMFQPDPSVNSPYFLVSARHNWDVTATFRKNPFHQKTALFPQRQGRLMMVYRYFWQKQFSPNLAFTSQLSIFSPSFLGGNTTRTHQNLWFFGNPVPVVKPVR
jgi:hypothetical protein